MTGQPTLSVIVRSMARPSLTAALASIAAQDYAPLEVLVVAACGPAHPPLTPVPGVPVPRLVASEARLARAAAANAGLDAATGDWITFLDDDDVFLPGSLSATMRARASAPAARVLHACVRTVSRDGRIGRIGHPHALIELYERNYISLCATVFARELVAAGCRFDESLDIYEDWDFALQLAQHAGFQFVPLESYEWHVDAGESGAGLGANRDAERIAKFRERVHAKWAARREALVARVAPLLKEAAALVQRGDVAGAQARCREALAASPNDPYALNVGAMVVRAAGDLRAARAMQELAVAIRPIDPGMVYNLAVLCRAQGDYATARRCCDRALALSPGFAPAQKLAAELAAAPA